MEILSHALRLKFCMNFLGAFAKLRIATISFVISVCPSERLPAWNNSASTGRVFLKFNIRVFFENMSRKL